MIFEDLNIIKPILQAVKEIGYNSPSPIQQQAIPIVLSGSDLIGCAQTGTGKTAAFAIPALQRISLSKEISTKAPRILVLTPTRELAGQISENFTSFSKHLPIRQCL